MPNSYLETLVQKEATQLLEYKLYLIQSVDKSELRLYIQYYIWAQILPWYYEIWVQILQIVGQINELIILKIFWSVHINSTCLHRQKTKGVIACDYITDGGNLSND